jgi:hypothetical protein
MPLRLAAKRARVIEEKARQNKGGLRAARYGGVRRLHPKSPATPRSMPDIANISVQRVR